MEFVRETPTGLIFPKNIAQERSNRAQWAIVTLTVALFSVGVFFTKENKLIYSVSAISTILLYMFSVEVLVRICKLLEEINHLHSRYNNNLNELLVFTFSFQIWNVFVFFFSLTISMIIFVIENQLPIFIMFDNTAAKFIWIPCTLLLNQVYNFEHSPLNESLQTARLKGIDYGSGMGHSFFYGYLRIVLPMKGTEEKGLLEFITDYEDKHNIKFDVKKLFILIPMSLHCPPRLDSYSSVERCTELESIIIDRAGVSKRNYKNSVYKIKTKSGNKQYVVAEYATPVKTLKEVMAENTPYSKLYRLHHREITLNFYLTLMELIKNDRDCCNICEIIYYDDLDQDGDSIDVGDIISERMTQILEKNK